LGYTYQKQGVANKPSEIFEAKKRVFLLRKLSGLFTRPFDAYFLFRSFAHVYDSVVSAQKTLEASLHSQTGSTKLVIKTVKKRSVLHVVCWS
jgi:hypothetical protein